MHRELCLSSSQLLELLSELLERLASRPARRRARTRPASPGPLPNPPPQGQAAVGLAMRAAALRMLPVRYWALWAADFATYLTRRVQWWASGLGRARSVARDPGWPGAPPPPARSPTAHAGSALRHVPAPSPGLAGASSCGCGPSRAPRCRRRPRRRRPRPASRPPPPRRARLPRSKTGCPTRCRACACCRVRGDGAPACGASPRHGGRRVSRVASACCQASESSACCLRSRPPALAPVVGRSTALRRAAR